jgi:hypothetical protein
MNQTPFSPEEDEYRISYTGGTAVTALIECNQRRVRIDSLTGCGLKQERRHLI